MKKIVAILLCTLLLAPGAMSLAENPLGDLFDNLPGSETPPRSDGGSIDHFTVDVGGETVQLAFDPSPQYSSILGGTVQASYYAYGADNKTLYELYITFPETARAGMILTPEYAALTNTDSSVVLIVSRDGEEKYFFSSLYDGKVYPENSTFTISLDSVTEDGGAVSYAGTLSASLIALDMSSGGALDSLEIPATPFQFTITGQLSSPLPEVPQPEAPQPTRQPDDLKKV